MGELRSEKWTKELIPPWERPLLLICQSIIGCHLSPWQEKGHLTPVQGVFNLAKGSFPEKRAAMSLQQPTFTASCRSVHQPGKGDLSRESTDSIHACIILEQTEWDVFYRGYGGSMEKVALNNESWRKNKTTINRDLFGKFLPCSFDIRQ